MSSSPSSLETPTAAASSTAGWRITVVSTYPDAIMWPVSPVRNHSGCGSILIPGPSDAVDTYPSLIAWGNLGRQAISPTSPAGSTPSVCGSRMRTSNAGLTVPDVPGTPWSETALYATGNASVSQYIVTTRQPYRVSILRQRSA